MRPRLDLPHRAHDFGMPFVADQQGVEAVAGVALGLGMDLGDQRTCGVDIDHRSPRGLQRHRLGHAMGGKHHRPVVRAVGQLLDEDSAHGLQALHHMGVVDDLVPDIDRRPPLREGLLDDLDRPVDPGAEAARRGQPDQQGRPGRTDG